MRMLKPALTALAVAIMAAPALAQVPRAPNGKPDLNGVWTNISLTPLERAPENKALVVSEAEAEKIASRFTVGGIKEEGYKSTYSDPTKGAPPKGGDDFGVQAYDSFWWDPGTKLAFVKGEWRTSNIVDPPNGVMPLKDPEAAAKKRKMRREVYETGKADYDGPEVPTLGERCVMFGSKAGPGMQPGGYNNNYQFTQTADHFVIQVEMGPDTRIVPIFATADEARKHHKPATLAPWTGDSVGWWEGDTFVMESINVKPLQAENHSFPLSSKGVVTERFTRTSDKDIFYEFIVNDPELYTRPWRAELAFSPSTAIYEYACHEGNYGMIGILAGAREKDRRAAAKSAKVKTVKGGQ